MDAARIAPYDWWNEALHGFAGEGAAAAASVSNAACYGEGDNRTCATSFPAHITTASSFNRSLVRAGDACTRAATGNTLLLAGRANSTACNADRSVRVCARSLLVRPMRSGPPSVLKPASSVTSARVASRSGRPTSTSFAIRAGVAVRPSVLRDSGCTYVSRTFLGCRFRSTPPPFPRSRHACRFCCLVAGQETPGEDPTVNANWAEDFVGGFQAPEASGEPGGDNTADGSSQLKVRSLAAGCEG